jgi:hypothetical protein
MIKSNNARAFYKEFSLGEKKNIFLKIVSVIP